MAYVDQNQSGQKTVSAVVSGIILAAVGYAFINGLAYDAFKKAATKLNVIDIQTPPPPPPKKPPPPPPKETPKVESPPIVTPPPVVQPPVVAPTVITAPKAPPPVPQAPIAPAPPPVPPAPPKPSQASPAKARGNPGDWVTPDDYPPAALRQGAQGVTGFRLDVGPDGRVTNCTVTSSSGNTDLDQTACRLLPRRARFTPAKDASGNGIATTYSNNIRWQVPKD
ncbi:energy transducer TonB [Sphingomonas abietis]|uniref:Energy transducer TonB n=1 Tax=Sphingomonas abietis TaxID=3012344 RepID=A0ABY7NKW8_9SPHN|nr:energy transducer TonB [Sphingomonas abietis]WBO22197.1 energy transducer TonB [Sphingomonas abietis]